MSQERALAGQFCFRWVLLCLAASGCVTSNTDGSATSLADGGSTPGTDQANSAPEALTPNTGATDGDHSANTAPASSTNAGATDMGNSASAASGADASVNPVTTASDLGVQSSAPATTSSDGTAAVVGSAACTTGTCTAATCGDGKREGSEGCDDGNRLSLDGCSADCQPEPVCADANGCTSPCGDGLVVNEACDDGNLTAGDGCSPTCEIEAGFSCTQAPQGATLHVPAIFRDFSATHPDFDVKACATGEEDPVLNMVMLDLDAKGRPVLNKNGAGTCVQDAASFATWYVKGQDNVEVHGSIALYDNYNGALVNRFGAKGEKLTTQVNTPEERGVGEDCSAGCKERVLESLACDHVCSVEAKAVQKADDSVAAWQSSSSSSGAEQLVIWQGKLAEAQTALTSCITRCESGSDVKIAACVADCRPCSYANDHFCTGGGVVSFDGTPLFFPVDDVQGATADLAQAKLPPQYGFADWPDEQAFFPGAGEHNFFFTTELHSWFRFDHTDPVVLDFTADDDLWVFINGKLALDLGGAHVPVDGAIHLSVSQTKLGLVDGNVYRIDVFHADRVYDGSTLKVTLPYFAQTPSVCQKN